MIISTNKRSYGNPEAGTSGILQSAGGWVSGQNVSFMGFKPAAYCKKAGYLRITITGYFNPTVLNQALSLNLVLSKPNVSNLQVAVLHDVLITSANNLFTATLNIPVGTGSDPESNSIIIATTLNSSANLHERAAYIDADTDEVMTGHFTYTYGSSVDEGSIRVKSVIAEYLEN